MLKNGVDTNSNLSLYFVYFHLACHGLDILITYQYLFGITIFIITMDKYFDTTIDVS